MHTPIPRLLLSASALAFAACASAALGQTVNQPPSMTVSSPGSDDDAIRVVVNYADLNLNTGPDAKAMAHRLHRAARAACDGDKVNVRDIATTSQFRSCYEAAMSTALKQIDNPLVAAAAGLPPAPARMAQR